MPDAAPPLLEPQFLARLEQLELVSRKIFLGRLKGERRSKRKGQSVEFADYRNYVVGDDLRFLAAHDSDPFNRWQAVQTLAMALLKSNVAALRQGDPARGDDGLMAALQALSGVMGYSIAKAGIDNFTRWLAVDVARRYGDGMRVNAIAPGFFVTTQNRAVMLNDDGSYTERAKNVLRQTPMGRLGRPEELVGAAQWLCSDAASFVTGTVIAVDGGFSVFSGV